MADSFNLLERPWLPCIDDQNKLVNLNLVEAIIQAHRLTEIRSDLPVITGSLYLFLIAYVMNIFKPETNNQWEALWQLGKFPSDQLDTYNQDWGDRFDLFDPKHPFYQDPKFGTREKDKKNLKKGKQPEPKGFSGFLLHLASGNNATLFDHSLDSLPETYSAAEAVQLLIMLQAYSLGGMSSASIAKDRYYKDSAFGRGILFLNKGQNLFETLMLNILSKTFDSFSNEEDMPCWEKDDLHGFERYSPEGILDLLTWQSRRILLLPKPNPDEIAVQLMLSAPGQSFVETFSNPFFHNRITTSGKKQSIKPLRFQIGRSLWRDSTAILNVNTPDTENPLPVKWTAHLQSADILEKQIVQLDLYGMCTQPGQKKAYFYDNETFTAPAAYLEDRELLEQLENGLTWAEQVRSDLYIAVRELARFIVVPMHDLEGIRTPGRDDTDPLMQHWNAEHHYWHALEPAFYEYLLSLPESESAHDAWENAIRQSAWDALNFAANQVGTDPVCLKAKAKAERSLGFLLYRTFNPEGKE